MTLHQPMTANQQTLDLLMSHRSIRRFRPDPVPDDHLRVAVAAGQMASTSSNIQAYCAIRVTDPAARAEIADLAGPQPKIVDCGAFLVVCGDTRRHRFAAADAGNAYVTGLEAFSTATIDSSLFAEKLSIALESMGYGICYIGGVRNDLDRLGRVLEIPEGVYPLFGLCVGVPMESPTPRPRLPLDAVLVDNRYPSDDAVRASMAAYDEVYVKYMAERAGPVTKPPCGWTETRAGAYTEVKRPGVRGFYESRGASLA